MARPRQGSRRAALAGGSGRLRPSAKSAAPRRSRRQGTKFICGEPRKPATNRVAGRSNSSSGGALLLDHAVLEQHDPVGQRHGLDLVVGDVDRGLADLLVQPLDLGAHPVAELGVEVGERLVEQEQARVAHDGAADGDPLALAARQLARQALEQVADAEHGGGAVDPAP